MPMVGPVTDFGAGNVLAGINQLGGSLRSGQQNALALARHFQGITDEAARRRFQWAQLQQQKEQAQKARRDAWARTGIGIGASFAGPAIVGGMAAGQAATAVPDIAGSDTFAGSDKALEDIANRNIVEDNTQAINALQPAVPQYTPAPSEAAAQFMGPSDPMSLGRASPVSVPTEAFAQAPAPALVPPATQPTEYGAYPETYPGMTDVGSAGTPAGTNINQLSDHGTRYPGATYRPFAGGNRAAGALAGGALGVAGYLSGHDYLTPALAMPGQEFSRGLAATKFGLDTANTSAEMGLRQAQAAKAWHDVNDTAKDDLAKARADKARADAAKTGATTNPTVNRLNAQTQNLNSRTTFLNGPQTDATNARTNNLDARTAEVVKPRAMNDLDEARAEAARAAAEKNRVASSRPAAGADLTEQNAADIVRAIQSAQNSDQAFYTMLPKIRRFPADMQVDMIQALDRAGKLPKRMTTGEWLDHIMNPPSR